MRGPWIFARSAGWRWMLPLALVVGCSGSGDDDDDETPTDELTLENCETSISSDAPAFFKDLFKCVTITTDGDTLTIESAGLPPHKSYYYGDGHPNYEDFDTSRGSQYRPNPNTIETQDLLVGIPLNPVSRGLTITGDLVDQISGTSQYEYHGAPGGIALDGVALFHGYAAPGDDIEQEKYTFDIYNGHPQDSGTYHYHTWTMGPLEVLAHAGYVSSTTPGDAEVEIYGIMCDGTVVLGCTEADGSSIQGAVDAQGGHVHDIVNDAGETWFAGRYHTHVCEGARHFTPEIQYYEECGVAGPSGPPQ